MNVKQTRDDFLGIVYEAARQAAHGTASRDQLAILWAAGQLQKNKAALKKATKALAEVEQYIVAMDR